MIKKKKTLTLNIFLLFLYSSHPSFLVYFIETHVLFTHWLSVQLGVYVHSGKNKNNNNIMVVCILYDTYILSCLFPYPYPHIYIYYILIPFNKARAKTEA